MNSKKTNQSHISSIFTKDEPFISPYLNRQSVVICPQDGIHTSSTSPIISAKFKDIQTVNDLFLYSLKHYEHFPFFGFRSSVQHPYQWMSYSEVDYQIQAIGSALKFSAGHIEGTENFVGIYGRNCPEWLITAHACSAYGFVYVPLYDTLGTEAVQYILSCTEPQVVVCYSVKEVCLLMSNSPHHSLRYILLVQRCDNMQQLKDEYGDVVEILLFSEFVELGKKNLVPRSPTPADGLCTVCYTSGSTGIPKGAMINQEQIIASLFSVVDNFFYKFAGKATVHLSYLPLAHILEQLSSMLVILQGGRCAFLTGGVDTLLTDLQSVQPTHLVAVPRVLGRLRIEYYKKLPKWGFIRRCVHQLIETKISTQANGIYYSSGFLSTFFFRKFRSLLGGRIIFVMCGGAPLNVEVSRFIRAALDCPLIEGYGMTETSGVITTTLVGDSEYEIAGAITPGLEAKLCDVPEMGISVAKNGIGEIRVRGLRCIKGYYKDPKNTSLLYDHDGWLRTGEIGQWTESKALKIVDRCKNMFKLMQGEYIAPEKVEGIYQCSPLVQYAMVDGNPSQMFAVVVIVADMVVLRAALDMVGVQVAAHENFAVVSDEELCSDPIVRRFMLNDLNILGKEYNLKGFEMAKSIHISSDPFTTENGLLTPTMKVARYQARLYFKDAIQKMYDEGEL